MSEREMMRCVLAKHSGVLSARVAVLGVISMPGWKIKKIRKAAALPPVGHCGNSVLPTAQQVTEKRRRPSRSCGAAPAPGPRTARSFPPRTPVFARLYGCGKGILSCSAFVEKKCWLPLLMCVQTSALFAPR
ncbi:tuzin-like [Trypanosoma cruzi cruzi]|nr:tuzin-like [Trypanosoma cruzi cruzi]PBJ78147.1 tuzin-like [Trypanosoma cruzi cruzi]